MALQQRFGLALVAALALGVWTGCKDKGTSTPLDDKCERLAKACGDQDKHVTKIVEACKQAAAKQVEKGCTDKATAAYDCYENDLCGATKEKVWAFDDFRVLADR